ELRPMVVILGLAADVNEPVDRRRPAQDPPARVGDRAAVGARIGLGLEPPGQLLVLEQLHVPGRDVDIRVPVAPARLDQENLDRRVLGQPVGQHAAGRAAADDHVICLHRSFPSSVRVPPSPRGPRGRGEGRGEGHRSYAASLSRAAARIIAAPFSAIMIVGALVLVEVTAGITEASMTLSPSSPRTRSWSSTTAIGSWPILQVQVAWNTVEPVSRA